MAIDSEPVTNPTGQQDGAPLDEVAEEHVEISLTRLRVSRKDAENLLSNGDSR